jgi:ABC-2 type transport system permease protein
VLATQALAIPIIAWTANLRMSLGLGAVILGPAAAFSGVTFPLSAMPAAARAWAETLPLTHALVLTRAGISVGAPGTASGPLLALALTALLAFGLAAPRLPALLRDPVCWGRV